MIFFQTYHNSSVIISKHLVYLNEEIIYFFQISHIVHKNSCSSYLRRTPIEIVKTNQTPIAKYDVYLRMTCKGD